MQARRHKHLSICVSGNQVARHMGEVGTDSYKDCELKNSKGTWESEAGGFQMTSWPRSHTKTLSHQTTTKILSCGKKDGFVPGCGGAGL